MYDWFLGLLILWDEMIQRHVNFL